MRNALTGGIYIGQTTRTLGFRLAEHACHSKLDGKCRKLYAAIRKYGIGVFSIEELTQAGSRDELDQLEVQLIQSCDAMSRRNYNIMPGGSYGKHSQETKDLLSRIHTGRKQSRERVEKRRVSQIGKKHSDEWKANISAGSRGKSRSEAFKEKMRNRPCSLETRRRIGEKSKGRKIPEVAEANRRRTGIPRSEATKRKQSEALIEYWAARA